MWKKLRITFLFVLLYTSILYLGVERYELQKYVLATERDAYASAMTEMKSTVRKTLEHMQHMKGENP